MLIDNLKLLPESPWMEHQLTPRKLAKTLRPFEIERRQIRIDEKHTTKGYIFKELKAAFDLYLDDLSATSATDQ